MGGHRACMGFRFFIGLLFLYNGYFLRVGALTVCTRFFRQVTLCAYLGEGARNETSEEHLGRYRAAGTGCTWGGTLKVPSIRSEST